MLCMPVQVALPELRLQRLMPSLLRRSSVLPWLPLQCRKAYLEWARPLLLAGSVVSQSQCVAQISPGPTKVPPVHSQQWREPIILSCCRGATWCWRASMGPLAL